MEKTLKFDNIVVNKKEFHKYKQPIDLMSVNVDQIVVSATFKHSDEGFKCFLGYQDNEIVKPLCIILPQMSGYIKFLGNEVPKEKMHYTCIACITIDSTMKIEKKYLQVYLEECKYKVKKIQMSRIINAELESNSESNPESESNSDTELIVKLESNSDSE